MVEDLSQYHAPITKLFAAPVTEAEWEQYRLTDEQVAFYEEHGYLAGVKMFDDGQVERLRAELSTEMKAGEASFHHPCMIQGSHVNSADRPRRATVINVFRDGVRSNSDAPPLAGVPAIPKGQTMSGRFFPLLSVSARSMRLYPEA